MDVLFGRNVITVEEMNSMKITDAKPFNEVFVASFTAELRRHLQKALLQSRVLCLTSALSLATTS